MNKFVEYSFESVSLLKKLIHKNIRRKTDFLIFVLMARYTLLFRFCILNLKSWRNSCFFRWQIFNNIVFYSNCLPVFIFVLINFVCGPFFLFDENSLKVEQVWLCVKMSLNESVNCWLYVLILHKVKIIPLL